MFSFLIPSLRAKKKILNMDMVESAPPPKRKYITIEMSLAHEYDVKWQR